MRCRPPPPGETALPFVTGHVSGDSTGILPHPLQAVSVVRIVYSTYSSGWICTAVSLASEYPW